MYSKDIRYIGVEDTQIDLFEGQYPVPEGMLYNSYVILDEKVAVLDSVDANFKDEWLEKLTNALEGRTPDYLIVSHMEPDHSANIKELLDRYPNVQVVGTIGAFNMMRNLFGTDYATRRVVVKDNDKLELGRHSLTFITAPNVHWPEVMFTYDATDKVLFSADGFGKFGIDHTTEDWACEARRYYFGIVGKFGANVQAALKKVANLEIASICPLHGPELHEDLPYYLNLYNTWSSYENEAQGVTICYTSVYGHTKEAVEYLRSELVNKGVKVAMFDLARCDMAEAMEDACKLNNIVLATTTYNGGIFPYMNDFIHHLLDHNYQNKKVFMIENGMWAPMANKTMKAMLEPLKNITYAENNVTMKGAFNESVKEALNKVVNEIVD